MSRTTKRLLLIGALLTLGAVAAAFASAAGGSASNRHAPGNQLAGTWVVTAVRPAPLPPFTVHQLYTKNGSFLGFGNDGGARSPEYGSWERVTGRLYSSSGSFFRFNPQNGTLVGSTQINRTLRLSDDGQSFKSVGRVKVLDLDGNVIATFLTPASGERMQVERIPDMP